MASGRNSTAPPFGRVFWLTSWGDRRLFAVSQAGLVNNLNDGLAWGLLPLFFAAGGLALGEIGLLAAVYPAVLTHSSGLAVILGANGRES